MFIKVNLAITNNPNVYKWSFACNDKAKSNGKFHRRIVATPLLFVSTVTDEKYANDHRQIPFAIPQKILPITCKARQNLI